jgi:hypothetical protein
MLLNLQDGLYDRGSDAERHTEEFMKDLRAELVEAGLTPEKAKKIADIAWREGHSSGMCDVVLFADLCLEIIE